MEQLTLSDPSFQVQIVSVKSWKQGVKSWLRSEEKRKFIFADLPDYLKVTKWHRRAIQTGAVRKVGTVSNPAGTKSRYADEWVLT